MLGLRSVEVLATETCITDGLRAWMRVNVSPKVKGMSIDSRSDEALLVLHFNVCFLLSC